MNDFKKIMLVQPNKVTNARYNYSEREENILTLIIGELQDCMSRNISMQTDLFNMPIVQIDVGEAGTVNKRDYVSASKELMRKVIDFDWKDQDGQEVNTAATLLVAVHNYKNTRHIRLTLNKWAIPYLLYWGSGVGGTFFNKTLALTITGQYSKRLYKFCHQWREVGYRGMTLKEFKKMMMIEKKYSRTNDLKKRVLDSAREELKAMTDIYFDYTLEAVNSRGVNYIHFHIKTNNKKLPPSKKNEMYTTVYSMLNLVFPVTNSSRSRDLCDQFAEDTETLEKVYFRFKKLRDDMFYGNKSKVDTIKLIRHILKTDYGITSKANEKK